MTDHHPSADESAMPPAWIERLLDAALASSTAEFWQAIAEFLLDELPSDLLITWETFVVKLYRRAGGEITDEADAADAQALRSPQLYTALNLAFRNEVRSFSTKTLAKAGLADHRALRHFAAVHACSMDIVLPDNQVAGTIVLYGDTAHAELRARLLQLVRPWITRTYLTLRHRDRQFATGTALTEFLRTVPVGLIMVDWFGNILSVNDEGLRQAVIWNEGSNRASVKAAQARFVVAPQIQDAWQDLQAAWIESLRVNLPPPAPIVITHPRIDAFRATIGLIHSPDFAGTPCLMTRFSSIYTRAADTLFDPTPNQVSVLAELSLAERAVALFVLQGLSNKEIASKLGREISTIKDHLTSIYSKLGVRSRTQLIFRLNQIQPH